MTIAVGVKVHDGIVLASDSASTLRFVPGEEGDESLPNVYNHANKTFNLYKGLPVGMMAWGGGSIGSASISTLAKDFRRLLTHGGEGDYEWLLNPSDYSIRNIARDARRFFFEDSYQPHFEEREEDPDIGFMVAGYSSNADLPEIWEFVIQNGECPEPRQRRSREDTGISWSGQIEAITRLVKGHGAGLPHALQDLGVPGDQIEPAVRSIGQRLEAPLCPPPMPIQDAIRLAEFLVSTAVKFSQFTPGPSSVGGPIEVAAITKHESFKWVKRKHYFGARLNPEMRSNREVGREDYAGNHTRGGEDAS